ncbi:MAG: SpoIIE family protein phosphatase [Salinivirgaceae bacterium]|nr:SpoIIE family protein phosphatase [Salinivirgaceae bacterium]
MTYKSLNICCLRRFVTVCAAIILALTGSPSAFAQAEPDSVMVQKADSFLLKAAESMGKYDFENAAKQFSQATRSVERIADTASIIRVYVSAAKGFMIVQPTSTLRYLNQALGLSNTLKDSVMLSTCYRLLGQNSYSYSYMLMAKDYSQKAVEIDSSIRCPNLARDFCLLGYIHNGLAEQQHSDSLARVAIGYFNETLCFCDSLNFQNEMRDYALIGLAGSYIGLAENTGNQMYTDTCQDYLNRGKKLESVDMATLNSVRVRYFIQRKQLRQALNLIKPDSTLYFLTKVGQIEYHRNLYKIYEQCGNYRQAFMHLQKFNEIDHEFHGETSVRTVVSGESRKSAAIERISHESERRAFAAEKRAFEADEKRMRVINISLACGLGMVLLLVLFVLRMLQIKRKSNKDLAAKNAELAEQKEEIETQRDTIKYQRDEIQASINYARRIQRSLLTPAATIDRIFPDHFLLYKPRSIVSGDYYWIGQFGDNKVCIVADCTGHGVPGGFMSVLGMTNLNYIVGQTVSPEEILNRLRDAIIMNLRQREDDPTALQDDDEPDSVIARSTDGMDAAVYVINEQQMTLTFAGANNPLVLIRGSEIQLIKANKMPVGIYARLNPFESTTIELQKGDCIYTYSDGYQDQFGNGSDTKFKGSRLRNLLLEIHERPMAEQKEILNRTYEEWRGPASNQTDDVVIMGVRV